MTAPVWVQATVPSAAKQLTEAGISQSLAELLARRGVESEAEAKAFLAPCSEHLHDPELLSGAPEALDRLIRARDEGQRVAIVGDYDVDGVSATALLTAVFRACGIDVVAILPNRLKEGYGLQGAHIEKAAAENCQLVVTADCGSTAYAAIDIAKDQGLDVIITDHHLGDRQLPAWVIEVNPSRDSCSYPFSKLSGVGVAYKLASGLCTRLDRDIDQAALLRVTCLGTICDLVPLLGENRVIASLGLAALAKTRSAGLRALIERARIRPPFTATDIGFRLGPRINAAGRLADPDLALELLLTTDPRRAAALARELDELNRERQGAEMKVVNEAEQSFAALDPIPAILVGWSEHWHRGVIGIAAGRIARRFHRPTVLFSVDGEQATGSGRSLREIHLHGFLKEWQADYRRFGGHSQAVGLTVPTSALAELTARWQQQAEHDWDPELLTRRTEYELLLSPAEVNDDLLGELRRLEPFGVGNRQPVLRVGPLRLSRPPRRFGKGHLGAAAVGSDGGRVDLLGWGWQEREGDLVDPFEVLGCLESDRYHGGPVLRLLDARPAT